MQDREAVVTWEVGMRTFASPGEVLKSIGEHLGYSEWFEVGQERINAFAEATGDLQWIHVDPRRASAGPFGTTIAHGFLTLSLVPVLVGQVYHVGGVRMAINYGLDRVRFPAPLPSGSRVRAGVELVGAEEVAGGGIQLRNRVTVEHEGGEKPVCVADTLTRFYL